MFQLFVMRLLVFNPAEGGKKSWEMRFENYIFFPNLNLGKKKKMYNAISQKTRIYPGRTAKVHALKSKT